MVLSPLQQRPRSTTALTLISTGSTRASRPRVIRTMAPTRIQSRTQSHRMAASPLAPRQRRGPVLDQSAPAHWPHNPPPRQSQSPHQTASPDPTQARAQTQSPTGQGQRQSGSPPVPTDLNSPDLTAMSRRRTRSPQEPPMQPAQRYAPHTDSSTDPLTRVAGAVGREANDGPALHHVRQAQAQA